MHIKKLNQNPNNSTKKRGFTLVEMVIVAPIVILVIGVFIFAIINMVGAVMASRGSNTLAYNIQQALSQIDQDVSASSGYLAVNNVSLTSPQGLNNDTTNFHNANSYVSDSDVSDGNMLILNSYATTTNPISSTRSYVYATDKPHACASTLVNQNAKITMNIIYFVKTVNNVSTLWRRVVAPSNYLAAGCSVPWQQPSCVPGYVNVFCKTQDVKLVDGVQPGGFNVSYFVSGSTTANVLASDATQSDTMRQAAMDPTNTVNVHITADATMAGRNISQTGSIRSINSNTTYKTQAPLSPVADWLATPQGDHVGNFYDLVTKQHATVTRAGAKTIYDPATQKIYDVPANYLGVNPRSDGKSGSEAIIEEGRTNYLMTSDFEQDTNSDGIADNWGYWPGFPAHTATSSIDINAIHGSSAQRIRYTYWASDNSIYFWQQVGGFSAGDTITGSFYIKGTMGGSGIKLDLQARDSGGNPLGDAESVEVFPSQTYQKVYVTYSNLPSNTSSIYFRIHDSNSALANRVVDITIDATQLEKGAFATSYIPTTTTTVTRNADNVTVPTINWSATGTWVTVLRDSRLAGEPTVFAWSDGTDTNRVGLWIYGSSMENGANDATGGWAGVYNPTVSSSYGVATLTLTPSSLQGYWNGAAGSAGSGRSPVSLQSTARLGSYSGNNLYFNDPIQRLVVYNSALTPSGVTTVTNAVKNGP